MEIDWKKHPDAGSKDISDIEEQIFLASVEKGVLISKGMEVSSRHSAYAEKEFCRLLTKLILEICNITPFNILLCHKTEVMLTP
jgi:hypothetical protein